MTSRNDWKAISERRLEQLRGLFAGAQIDGLLVSQPDNRRYLSGFSGSTGWLFVTPDVARFAADFRYWEQVEDECPAFELVRFGTGGGGFREEGLPGLLAGLHATRIGFEADHASYADVAGWQAQMPEREWVPTQGLIAGLRAIKDASEVELMRAAIDLADEALAAALAQARPGMTERDLAWTIEAYMRTHGAEGASFDTIVAGGPNGARPHAGASDRPLQPGEPIVIDMGAKLNAYCSDLTRTVCFGEPREPERFWDVYNTVLRAQQAAEAAAKPGMTGGEIDAVARDYIAAAGYGEQFGHGLGHGVGLAVHEMPSFRRLHTSPILPGSVVTVEPGIYLPGWGGVRIEDVVLVTDDGVEVLTGAPKDPILRL